MRPGLRRRSRDRKRRRVRARGAAVPYLKVRRPIRRGRVNRRMPATVPIIRKEARTVPDLGADKPVGRNSLIQY